MSGEPVRPEVDVAIVGGGINGACTFHELARAGYRVLLIDRGDFACGTSAASAMMIWGGLLYLKDWEVLRVARLCAARDELIARHGTIVRPRAIRYIPISNGRSRAFVQSMLLVYWLLGGARRRRPRCDHDFEEGPLLRQAGAIALTYEEAALDSSDARFVLSWILDAEGPGAQARNYCALKDAAFDGRRGRWDLALENTLTGEQVRVSARMVINAAGGWADSINRSAGIDSPCRHILSRGVSIAVPRDPRHLHHLAFDNGVGGGAMSLVPWGPVSLWGSTDTIHEDMASAARVDASDLRFLLGQLNRHLARPVGPEEVVSIRCGVRAVVVPRGARVSGDSARLSRRHRVHPDPRVSWITIYGGKLSGCSALAREVRRHVEGRIGHGRHEPAAAEAASVRAPAPGGSTIAGFGDVVDAAWSAAREHCRTLEDYLRRRTNLAQWVPRGGFGRTLEHRPDLHRLACAIHGDPHRAASDVEAYRARVDRDWNTLEELTT